MENGYTHTHTHTHTHIYEMQNQSPLIFHHFLHSLRIFDFQPMSYDLVSQKLGFVTL
jgi:hypothetical protein